MDFEFEKSTTVDSLDKVPEQFRGLYAEGEGGFVLAEAYRTVGKAVDGLNRSLKAARRDADDHKKKIPNMDAYAQVGQLLGLEGDDAVSADALRAAVEKVVSESKDGKVNWDKMKQSLEQSMNKKLADKDVEISSMGKTLQKYLVTTAAVQAIAANKGVSELLLPHITAKTKVIKDGEDYVVRVVDEAGDPRGNASGGFMTVEDLVKEMKASPVFGRAFESEAGGGSGSKPGSGQQRPTPPRQERSATDKIAAGLNKGQRLN